MVFASSQSLGRVGSIPLPGDAPSRRSLDSASPCAARSRRGSVDMRASRGEHALATSVLSARAREGVQIDVGRSVDFNEQRRRLEHFWNTEDQAALETQEPEGVLSDTDTEAGPSTAPRSHLEQRWQQTLKDETSHPTDRKGTGRRRQLGGLSSVRRRRLNARRRARSAGHIQTALRRKQSYTPGHSELADAQYLAKLSSGGGTSASSKRMVRDGLLSREAEVELGRIVQLGIRTQELLNGKGKETSGPLAPEEQEAAVGIPLENIQMRLSNQHVAQQLLIRFNTRLIAKVAKAFQGRGLELEDLMSEGIAGLERAIQRFDPAKGYRFSTYAYMWIRQAISRSIAEEARLVRLPGHVFEAVGRIQKARDMLSQTQDEPPTDEQVAKVLGIPAEKVTLYTQASRTPTSLESSVQSQLPGSFAAEETVMAELLRDTAPTADEELVEEDSQRLLRQDIDSVLSGLSLRERNILRYRYGLHTEAMSLADLSAAYGLSKERLRQIGEVALSKLQLRQASNGTVNTNGRVRHVPILRPEMYGCI